MNSKSPEIIPLEVLNIKISGKSEPSLKHPDRNEDAIGFDEKAGWAAVLDGVGGGPLGDLASKKGLEVLTKRLAESVSTLDQLEKQMVDAFQEASQVVSKEAGGGSTTAVAVKTLGNYAIVASVGDSRVYINRRGLLTKITDDDSLMPAEISNKIDNALSRENITGEEYDLYFRKRNVITKALNGSVVIVHTHRLKVQEGDRMILTTDGISDNLTSEEIRKVASEGGEVAGRLVELATARSQEQHFRAKMDDISAVVIEVVEE